MNKTLKETIGIVYKISSPYTDLIYIGSTLNPARRWTIHKNEFKSGKAQCCNSAKVLLFGDCSFTELACCKITTRKQLVDIEIQIMKQYPNCVNKMQLQDSKSMAYRKIKNDKATLKTYFCETCNIELKYNSKSRHVKRSQHLLKLQQLASP